MNQKKQFGYLWLVVISISFAILSFYAIEPDYFWHIKAGEYMVHHGILTKDIFSWLLTSKYWMSHEWLFEVLLYSLKTIFGTYHVYVYSFLSIFMLSSVLFFPNREKITKNIPFSMIYLLFFLLLFIPFVQARPHMISFSFLSFTLWVLMDLYENEDSKKIYFLPVITILWANVHGGSSNLPYLLSFLFFLIGFFPFTSSKMENITTTKKQRMKYLVITLLCMIGVFCNIHGYKMFFYPYQNMGNMTMISSIVEWQPTTLNDVSHYLYYAFLLFLLFLLLFSRKKIRFIDFMLLLFFAYLGLKSIRFWLYLYIASNYFVFYYVKKRKVDSGTSLVILFCCILMLVFAFYRLGTTSFHEHYHLSEKMIQTIKKENPKRLFNYYDYGGELIYHDIPVFIDGRADLYSNYYYEDYLNIVFLQRGFPKLLEKYHFDYYLVSKDNPIYGYLNLTGDFEEVFHDKTVYLFKRKETS